MGLPLGLVALSIFKSVLPADTLGLSQVGLDGQVIAAMAALAILTGFVFGLAPALSVSETDLAHTTKTGAQRASGSVWTTVRNALIGLEVALTFLLVVSAALLLRSLGKLSDTQPGFDPTAWWHFASARIRLPAPIAMPAFPSTSGCLRERGNCQPL